MLNQTKTKIISSTNCMKNDKFELIDLYSKIVNIMSPVEFNRVATKQGYCHQEGYFIGYMALFSIQNK